MELTHLQELNFSELRNEQINCFIAACGYQPRCYYLAEKVSASIQKKYLLNIILYAVSGIFWFWVRSKAIGDFPTRNEIEGALSKNGEVGVIPFLLNLQTIPESLANFFIPFDIDALPNFSLYKTLLGSVILFLMV